MGFEQEEKDNIFEDILSQAVEMRATDIHIEPFDTETRIRFRIDGVLHEVKPVPVKYHETIITCIKNRLNNRDGWLLIQELKKTCYFRSSFLNTRAGETAVVSIIDRNENDFDLIKIGFDEDSLLKYKMAIDSPYGIVLISGPVGSGKITTVYSTLEFLNYPDVKIMTVEDPVCYPFKNIIQVQVDHKTGLTSPIAIRKVLAQDPDIIFTGEMQDKETIDMTIKAANTGHLVLSTVHASKSSEAICSLLNMGADPKLISSSLVAVVCQVLARKICLNCKETYGVTQDLLEDLRINIFPREKTVFYRGVGCEKCSNTGYKGRTGIYEVLKVSEEIKKSIINHKTAEEIQEIAVKEGMVTLRQAGINKLLKGITSIEEVFRTT